MAEQIRTLTLAHSPDSDDAFMFWAMARGHVGVEHIKFEHILSDIQTLNQAAIERRYDISAISVHAYPYVARDYALLNVGASVGDGYGPILVSKYPMTVDELSDKTVGIPGVLTTAALVLRLAVPGLRSNEIPFDKVLEAVEKGEVDAGLIIHEGQLTYKRLGFHKVMDLGEWWREETGLPLPLGANIIRRELGDATINTVAGLMRESIQHALKNRGDAIGYARDYGRDLEDHEVDRFVGMYVNEFTVDWGEKGRAAVTELLNRGSTAGIIPPIDAINFAG